MPARLCMYFLGVGQELLLELFRGPATGPNGRPRFDPPEQLPAFPGQPSPLPGLRSGRHRQECRPQLPVEIGNLAADQPGEQDVGMPEELFETAKNVTAPRVAPPGAGQGTADDHTDHTREPLVLLQKQSMFGKTDQELVDIRHGAASRAAERSSPAEAAGTAGENLNSETPHAAASVWLGGFCWPTEDPGEILV